MLPEQVVVDAQHDTAIALFVQQEWYAALEGQNVSVETEVRAKSAIVHVVRIQRDVSSTPCDFLTK